MTDAAKNARLLVRFMPRIPINQRATVLGWHNCHIDGRNSPKDRNVRARLLKGDPNQVIVALAQNVDVEEVTIL